MHKFDFHPEFSRDYPRIKRARYYPSGGELFQIQKMNSSGLLWTPSKRQKGKLFSADEEAFHGCEESKLKIGWSVCRQAERRFSQVHREKGSLSLLSHSFSLFSLSKIQSARQVSTLRKKRWEEKKGLHRQLIP